MQTFHLIDRLAHWAELSPTKQAVTLINPEHTTPIEISYLALHQRALAMAQWLCRLGLQTGDGIALLLENHIDIISIGWGAKRAGLYFTPISTHLNPKEIAYILQDCDAKYLITSQKMAALASQIKSAEQSTWTGTLYSIDGDSPGCESLEAALHHNTDDFVLPERMIGRDFLYSSGTTGRPKGIKRPLTPFADRFKPSYDTRVWSDYFGLAPNAVYLTMAPLYHAAPLRSTMRAIEYGGSAIISSRFDAELALQLIDRYQATHSQWVPTMMIRMLDLPDSIKQHYSLNSMKVAIHAAAPCPPEIKKRMIAWWGPVWYEYYAGSESIGLTALNSHEWLEKPQSVGKAILGTIHIKDDDGNEVPAQTQGRIYFSGTPQFQYHNDPAKTQAAYDHAGHATYGDIGHVDDDGYLYISGRRTDLIISGGVNIYPQEIEHAIILHPAVADVAVIGVAHPQFGEEVKAVIELKEPHTASPALADAIMALCLTQLGKMKCPKSIDFTAQLPRSENGKLYKRLLMQQYQSNTTTA